ncbi:MAG: hypothetical protein FJX74_05830 [Armatimonadetes bacterium]|nr:hypothetical protein [Armatimonadota bacterium]
MAHLSDPDIDARIRRIEGVTGKPVILRPVRPSCRCFRGRVVERSHCFLIEYRDEQPGYFWDLDLLRELLDCVEQQRGRNVTLYDGDVQYVEVTTRRPFRRTRPPRRTEDP